MTTTRTTVRSRVPRPKEPPDARDMPHGLTIFLTGRDRARVLRALRRLDGNRAVAIKRALGLD
ncbi:MAG TPA: hypothetical protein PLU35_01810 [Phycisphaerales bacterium]|nr:hypothetical protein [Phycisphaerales bacterium]